MKKPTLEEVKEYFKDAKEVECTLDPSDVSDITKCIKINIHEHRFGYWITLDYIEIKLWDKEKGYAKIISYKTPSTNFISLDSSQKQVEKTIFEKRLSGNSQHLIKSTVSPSDFKNVLHIGRSIGYGDVFKCWNDDENDFFLTFGTKGDEFENN